ncbi:amine oxidase [Hypoxylon trugodes]|uniref:amine oxidase n=1 Tax=Hypoxylon trugodes TaxID=326681 RepID=UPI002194BF9A|nr:amine oxidase [Hypoxylon trugodes]KAI1390863.1 amine oxidase [Hypoxylon trugodes]
MQFSERLAEELHPGTVQLATPVTKIQQLGTGTVRVSAGLSKTVYCKKVIISAPTSTYSQIEFLPPLPAPKRLLSESTILGYTSKVVLVFERPWWREGPKACSGSISCADGPITFSRDTSYPDQGLWSITCFINGKHAREWCPLPEARRKKEILEYFNKAMGTIFEIVPPPIAIHEISWSNYQWYPGGPCPGMGPNLLTSEAGLSLCAPFGDVHFVGTETALKNPGYMDGALHSGSRGANEVMAALEGY